MREPIYITNADSDQLRRLIARRRGTASSEHEYLDRLEEELDRAEVVPPTAIPRDVVTMNSRVRLRDLDSGAVRVYQLVFPTAARTGDTVSILAPIGTALLGYRVGDVIEWPVPKGLRRLEVLAVLDQPEAARAS